MCSVEVSLFNISLKIAENLRMWFKVSVFDDKERKQQVT